MSRARALPAIVFVLSSACGGAAFEAIPDDDAGDARSVVDAGATDDGAIASDGAVGADVATDRDGLAGLAELIADADAGVYVEQLCCTWQDAGSHPTSCGAGDWACVRHVDGGPDQFDTCFETDAGCASGACVLNDSRHGLVFGEVTRCP